MDLEYITDKIAEDIMADGYNNIYPIKNCNLIPGKIISYYDSDLMIDRVYITSRTEGSGYIMSKFNLDRKSVDVIKLLTSVNIKFVHLSEDVFYRGILNDYMHETDESIPKWDECVTDEDKIRYSDQTIRLKKRISGFSCNSMDKDILFYEYIMSMMSKYPYFDKFLDLILDLGYKINDEEFAYTFNILIVNRKDEDEGIVITVLINDEPAIIKPVTILRLIPVLLNQDKLCY